MSDQTKDPSKGGSEFSLEQLLSIFGVVDPKILCYVDHCNDMNKHHDDGKTG